MVNIFIIIVNWNGTRDTIECLQSLEKLQGTFRVLLVDNGSEERLDQIIPSLFPAVTLIETGENLGFAGGNNIAIQRALDEGADALFLLNNDTIVDPHLLNAFLLACQNHPDVGIFGAKNYLFDHPEQLDHLGGMWNKKTGNFDLVGYRAQDEGSLWNQERILDYACGCSLFIKREVFEKIGLLEPKFFLLWEESDFCFRAKRAGFLTLSCPEAKIWHKVSASFKSKPHSTYFWWRNRLFWIERNSPPLERLILLFTVLLPEIAQLLKLTLLKSIQNKISPTPERLLKQKRYRAALSGVKDYLFRRFGKAPPWIFTSK